MDTTPTDDRAARAVTKLLNDCGFTMTVGRLMEAAYLRGQADLLREQRDALEAERDRFREDRPRFQGREHSDEVADDQRALARFYRGGAL